MFDFHKTERLIQSTVQGNSLFNVMGQEIIEYGPSVIVTRLAGWLSVCGKSLNFSVLFVCLLEHNKCDKSQTLYDGNTC